MKKPKIHKIDQPIRQAIEITISKLDTGPEVFEGHVAFELRFGGGVKSPAYCIHQLTRFVEKLAATAIGIHAALDTTIRINPQSSSGTIKISHDVFTPLHLWREVAMPVCGLDPDLFEPSANVLVPSNDVMPNWDTSRDPA